MAAIDSELLDLSRQLKKQNSNEAETRKKIIDKILEGILGWNEKDITYEERVSEDGVTKYSDYIVRTANTAFLVEAKRIGTNFNVSGQRKRAKLNGSIMDGELGKAIIQARDYCRKKSIPFAVVTNGIQWLIFPGTRTDQIEFSQSTVIIFDSLERILGEELPEFTSLLSREGVIEGNMAIELIGRDTDQIEERRLNNFFINHNIKSVNPIYPLIEHAIVKSFSDSIVDGDESLLDKCYVKNADRIKFDSRIQMHIQKSQPIFSAQPKKPMRKKEQHALKDAIGSSIRTTKPIAILILGTVGTGKTTFLQYTRKVSAKAFFEKSPTEPYNHWIDIDFRDFSKNEKPIDFIYERLFDYLKKDDYFKSYDRSISNAYKDDIDALMSGPMSMVVKDEESLNNKISETIMAEYKQIKPYTDKSIKNATNKCSVFLSVDNVDQFEDEKTQSEIFADAIAVASRLKINLIISMRESTYINHRSSPTFDAFDFDPIQIDPPEIPAVLSRRFFMARNMLAGTSGKFVALNGANFEVNDLSIFIDIVQSSVLGTEIGTRIDVLANHDVRLALRMTREFLAKGYTDPAKALSTYKSNGSYTLPKHEAFRSILLGNQSVYSEKYSVIGNPFDSRLGKNQCELLRLFILSALVRKYSENGNGYVEGTIIRDKLNILGFSEADTLKALSDLCEIRFIHTSSYSEASISSSYYPTRLGGYIIRNLLGDLTFIENVMMDTFIADKSTWDELKRLYSEITEERNTVTKMKLRTQSALKFHHFVSEQYKTLQTEAIKRNFESYWLVNPLEESKNSLNENINRALSSAATLYGHKAKKGAINVPFTNKGRRK